MWWSKPRPAGFIIRAYAPLMEAWLVEGAHGRVSMRWTYQSGVYTLEVDTLADGTNIKRPFWLPVDHVQIAPPPKGYAIGTECSRDHSLRTGGLVAVVRTTGDVGHADVLSAWDLDVRALRITPSPTHGVQCLATGWGARQEAF